MELKDKIMEMEWYELMQILKEKIEKEDPYVESVNSGNGNYEMDMLMVYQVAKEY